MDYPIYQAAWYIHNNGDKEPVIINGYDPHGNAWVTWCKDGFKNMVSVGKLEVINDSEL